MLTSEQEFELSSTWCRHRDRPCLEGLRCARSLMAAVHDGVAMLDDSFEIEGSGELTGCGFACPFAFVVKRDGARLECGATGADAAATIVVAKRGKPRGRIIHDASC